MYVCQHICLHVWIHKCMHVSRIFIYVSTFCNCYISRKCNHRKKTNEKNIYIIEAVVIILPYRFLFFSNKRADNDAVSCALSIQLVTLMSTKALPESRAHVSGRPKHCESLQLRLPRRQELFHDLSDRRSESGLFCVRLISLMLIEALLRYQSNQAGISVTSCVYA